MKKRLAIFVVLILFILGGLAVLGKYSPKIDQYLAYKRAQRIMGNIAKQKEAREEALRADIYGGKTPEETVQLLIKALEAGDLDLAIKYYHIDSQEEAAEDLRAEWEESGNVDKSVSYYREVLEKGKKTCEESEDGKRCVLSYFYITADDEVLEFGDDSGSVLIPGGTRQKAALHLAANGLTWLWKVLR